MRTDLVAADLPDDLGPLLGRVERAVPAGVGRGHDHASARAGTWLRDHRPATDLDAKQARRAAEQFGTLGAGNHFAEVCLDDQGDRVWLVLHAGSRGVGNSLAQAHIAAARRLAREAMVSLEDPDLAWFVQGTPEFERYIADMLWAQAYALASREAMMDAFARTVFGFVGRGRQVERINCHHNFCVQETHAGRDVWVTRKGAIRARVGDLGVIPGSMGASTYVVRGRGDAASFESCSHGAGRHLSRSEAKRRFNASDVAEQMAGRTWLAERADALVDEIPAAYKDIDQVMADQADLVEVVCVLRQVLNYKGC